METSLFEIGGKMSISVSSLTPYVITLDNNSQFVDLSVIKQHGVVGAFIDAGHLFTPTHIKLNSNTDWVRNPYMTSQIQAVKDADLKLGLFFHARATNIVQVKEEINGVDNIIRNNYVDFGVWLVPELTLDTETNDLLLDTYYTELSKLGVTERIGLYCTRSFLNQITWKHHCVNWYLWLVDHVNDVSVLDELLDPEFFDV